MFGRFFIIFSVFILLISSLNTPDAHAVTTPDFPTCTNPTGNIKVQYNEGTHGVVGNSAEFEGKDSVYSINDAQVLQCLCMEDNDGIQTNWWKVSSLNDSDIQSLKNQGWHYVANGALWGLDNAPYMAKNSEYECGGGIGGGEVLGLATTASDAATTGNKAQLYSTLGIGLGFLFLLLGFLLLRKGNSDTRSV